MQEQSHGLMGTDLELCLDFTDVVDWRNNDSRRADGLASYAELLDWSRKRGILSREEAASLDKDTSKEEGEKVVAHAVRLREAIYRIFSAVAHGSKAALADLDILNEYLARGFSRVRVSEEGRNYEWDWDDKISPDMMLYPIASSAAGLLTSSDLARVRECANEEEGCGSLFLDCSKSQTRRWCSMKSCGNRMKFRAYYERHNHPKSDALRAHARAS